MHTRTGKVLLAVSGLVVCGGVAAFLTLGGSAQTAALSDVGRFRAGSALGERRAGFSGRPKVQVFADRSARDWPGLEACLKSPEVGALLDRFTPVLADASDPAEAGAEADLRAAGFQVVVRGLDGGFLGGLGAGHDCAALVGLLAAVRDGLPAEPKESPMCTLLRERPEVVDEMLRQGNRAEAEECLELLRELDGEGSGVVAAVEARLSR
jgi:hypothetical protein